MPTTVLAADIRSFGRMLDQHGSEQAAEVIERFAAITSEVVEQLGGRLVHVWADDAFVLFRSAEQAVRAATKLHRRYDEVAVPGGGTLGVGIGIATGEAIWVSTGYIGRAVAVAANLCRAAGPRQTLADAYVQNLTLEICGLQFQEHPPVHLLSLPESLNVLQVVAIE